MTDKPDEQLVIEQRHRDAAMGVLNHAFRNEPIKGVSGECFDDMVAAFACFERDHFTRDSTQGEAVGLRPPFAFTRYVDGIEMAEGVTIEREQTLEAAMKRAAVMCPHTSKPTVLVLTALAGAAANTPDRITPEWCLRMAELEEGQEIGAGALDHPLRLLCEIPPAGWWCSRKPGHEGPCTARPIEADTQGAEERAAKIAELALAADFGGNDIAGIRNGIYADTAIQAFVEAVATLTHMGGAEHGVIPDGLREALERIRDWPHISIMAAADMQEIATNALASLQGDA